MISTQAVTQFNDFRISGAICQLSFDPPSLPWRPLNAGDRCCTFDFNDLYFGRCFKLLQKERAVWTMPKHLKFNAVGLYESHAVQPPDARFRRPITHTTRSPDWNLHVDRTAHLLVIPLKEVVLVSPRRPVQDRLRSNLSFTAHVRVCKMIKGAVDRLGVRIAKLSPQPVTRISPGQLLQGSRSVNSIPFRGIFPPCPKLTTAILVRRPPDVNLVPEPSYYLLQ
jgi:hypothetical protein